MSLLVNFQDAIERIKEGISLSSVVVESGVSLKHGAREKIGLCPFHDERTPSFSVNDEKGVFYCRGCQATGDVIEYVSRHRGITVREAIDALAGSLGIEIQAVARKSGSEHQSGKYERHYALFSDVVTLAHNCLLDLLELPGHPVTDYLEQRGIHDSLVREYRLGFLPSEQAFEGLVQSLPAWSDLSPTARRSYLSDLGLMQAGRIFSPFQGRLLFPVTDAKGREVALSGRLVPQINPAVMPKDREAPKYYNSPETDIFSKSHTLFGYAPAAKVMQAPDIASRWRERFRSPRAYLVEGFTDVLALAKTGLYAVAAMGTAVSTTHFRLLFRRADVCVMLLDGDEAGIRSARKALLDGFSIMPAEKRILWSVCPPGQDPAELLFNQAEPLECLESLPSVFPETVWLDEVVQGGGRPLSLGDQIRLERALANNGSNQLPGPPSDPDVRLALREWIYKKTGYYSGPAHPLRFADQPLIAFSEAVLSEGCRYWLHRAAQAPRSVLLPLKGAINRWWVRDALRGLLWQPEHVPAALQLMAGAAICLGDRLDRDHRLDSWPDFAASLMALGYPSGWLSLWKAVSDDRGGHLKRLGYLDEVKAPDLWAIEIEEWVNSVDQSVTDALHSALILNTSSGNQVDSGA